MTQTRTTNGHAKATSKRVGKVHHEYETPDSPHVTISETTQATVSIWRLVAIIGTITFFSVSSTGTIVWWFASDRAASATEITSIKTDVKALTATVNDFKDSVKELSGNLRYLSSGVWSRQDMRSFCRNFEAINAGAKLKCPAVELSTGSLK